MRPALDADPVFCGILDHARGGHFALTLGDAAESRQTYIEDTAVLQTELCGASGLVRITDACTVPAGVDLSEDVSHSRGELLRRVEVLHGNVELRLELAPRGGAAAECVGGGLRLRCARFPDLRLQLTSSMPLRDPCSTLRLRAGERLWLSLRWTDASGRSAGEPEAMLSNTVDAWRRWMTKVTYAGPQRALVRRSALTLKLLDYSANGAIIAAPTASLPEKIGGQRNWDYRYTWVRDHDGA